MTDDYSKSKFENALAERAYDVILNGFAIDSTGDVEVGPGHYDLVDLDEERVIIRTDNFGFVWLAEGPMSSDAADERWQHIIEQLDYDEEEWERRSSTPGYAAPMHPEED